MDPELNRRRDGKEQKWEGLAGVRRTDESVCRAVGWSWELGGVDNCRGNRSGSQGEWVWIQPQKAFGKGW